MSPSQLGYSRNLGISPRISDPQFGEQVAYKRFGQRFPFFSPDTKIYIMKSVGIARTAPLPEDSPLLTQKEHLWNVASQPDDSSKAAEKYLKVWNQLASLICGFTYIGVVGQQPVGLADQTVEFANITHDAPRAYTTCSTAAVLFALAAISFSMLQISSMTLLGRRTWQTSRFLIHIPSMLTVCSLGFLTATTFICFWAVLPDGQRDCLALVFIISASTLGILLITMIYAAAKEQIWAWRGLPKERKAAV